MAHDRRARAQHDLDQPALAVLQVELVGLVLRDRHAGHPAQFVHGVDDADERDAIVFLEQLVRADRSQQPLAALDVEHEGVLHAAQPHLGDRAPRQRAAGQHARLDRVFARVLQLLDRALPLGQQVAARDEDVDEADRGQRQADPGEVEQPEIGVRHGLDQHAVHDQVRARAHQGAHAGDDHHVVHRQQQLRDRVAEARRPLLRDRDEQRHDRGVVHHAGEHPGDEHQLALRPRERFWPPEHRARDPRHGARLAQSRDDHVQRRDGHDAAAREPLQRLVRLQDAEQRQRDHRADEHDVGVDSGRGEDDEDARHHEQRHDDLEGQGGAALMRAASPARTRRGRCRSSAGRTSSRAQDRRGCGRRRRHGSTACRGWRRNRGCGIPAIP